MNREIATTTDVRMNVQTVTTTTDKTSTKELGIILTDDTREKSETIVATMTPDSARDLAETLLEAANGIGGNLQEGKAEMYFYYKDRQVDILRELACNRGKLLNAMLLGNTLRPDCSEELNRKDKELVKELMNTTAAIDGLMNSGAKQIMLPPNGNLPN